MKSQHVTSCYTEPQISYEHDNEPLGCIEDGDFLD